MKRFYTAESVTEGHPDKLCDLIADSVLDAEKQPQVAKKPKLQLLGHDGNIFSIMGDARRLLRRNGQQKEAEEMRNRVQGCGDYYKALGIISEYAEAL